MSKIVLKGITWSHSRGLTPLLAAAQRYTELYPDVEISWKKRTLQEFADFPIEKLTEQYDLLIIDHPWVGCAAATECVLPLESYLPATYLQDQLDNSVGYSHLSYRYACHQWALAIDAATPAASYREDLLTENRVAVPETWDELIELAKTGRVAVPAIPIDILMNFYSVCLAHGKEPFLHREEVIDTGTGIRALETMQQLYSRLDREMFGYNPIAVAERMTRTDDFWYCPFAYCYSNYSRESYTDHILTYADVVSFGNQGRLRTTIGGTGLAVSAFSPFKEQALHFAQMVVSGKWQSGLYVEHGGQPGHRSAWTSGKANLLTNDFFTRVLPVMERGYTRPRYDGYLYFQDHAGDPIREYLLQSGNPEEVLRKINSIYQQSFEKTKTKIV